MRDNSPPPQFLLSFPRYAALFVHGYVYVSVLYTASVFFSQTWVFTYMQSHSLLESFAAFRFNSAPEVPPTTSYRDVLNGDSSGVMFWQPNFPAIPRDFLGSLLDFGFGYGSRKSAPIPMDVDLYLSKVYAESQFLASFQQGADALFGGMYANPFGAGVDVGNALELDVGRSGWLPDFLGLKVVPFYFRATEAFHEDELTITTIVTRNRFEVLKELVGRWKRPMSVAVHVPTTFDTFNYDLRHNSMFNLTPDASNPANPDETFVGPEMTLALLHELFMSSSILRRFVDVHLVIGGGEKDRRFNMWRNVARMWARTDLVWMLDVDFIPCGGSFSLNEFFAAGDELNEVIHKVREGRAAIVVPAFEYVGEWEGEDEDVCPRDKMTLAASFNSSQIAMFHANWTGGHNDTNYERFLFESNENGFHKVETYQHSYEPYSIFSKSGPPRCDERFVGYGGNKASCLFEMYLSGMEFYVLKDLGWLVHRKHGYEEVIRKVERQYNKRIYSEFREEMCHKYISSFRARGLLEAPVAQNSIQECKKVGVHRLLFHT